MPEGRGFLRVVSPADVTKEDDARSRRAREAEKFASIDPTQESLTDLGNWVWMEFDKMRRYRQREGIDDRLMEALRVYNGHYDPQKMQEIAQFGGSTVYSRLSAVKCRGATAMLRDVFLSTERPWDIKPTPEPTLPDSVDDNIQKLVMSEVQTAMAGGENVTKDQVQSRLKSLKGAAELAAVKQAEKAAKAATIRLDDLLTEGGFYIALGEFLIDLPIFPYAVIKGPVVRLATKVRWVNQQAVVTTAPKLMWERVSPFDIYWHGGAVRMSESDMIERTRFTRAQLNSYIGVPGFRDDSIKAILQAFPSGVTIPQIHEDTQRTDEEARENPVTNYSQMYNGLEAHVKVQGRLLKEFTLTSKLKIEDDLEYSVQVWLIDKIVYKVQINPNPRKRHPFYSTSFDPVPGSPVGHGLPEVIYDIQDVANAALRALVNNLAIASGPQIEVNVDRLAATEDAQEFYPWKRWEVHSDPTANNRKALEFFQPESRAAELISVYKEMSVIADEISAIPRYMTGSGKVGGAGRTASGLAMLMGNASKVLQNVAAMIDSNIMRPLLQGLYDMVMVTDRGGLLRGDESIEVRGVAVAAERETERMRRLEFLQITNNPTDMEITGIKGRAAVLRNVAESLGMEGDQIVPSDEQIKATMEAQQQVLQQQAPPGQNGGAPGQTPAPGKPAPTETQNMTRGPSGKVA